GRLLAAASRTQVKVWDVRVNQEVAILRGAPSRTSDNGFNPRVVWSPDGRRLAATNWDHSVAVWDGLDLTTQAGKATLPNHAEARRAAFHLDALRACLEQQLPFAADFHQRHLGAFPEVRDDPALLQARADLGGRLGDWHRAAGDYERLAARQGHQLIDWWA